MQTTTLVSSFFYVSFAFVFCLQMELMPLIGLHSTLRPQLEEQIRSLSLEKKLMLEF